MSARAVDPGANQWEWMVLAATRPRFALSNLGSTPNS
jgi:hypothetical protein